MGWDFWEGQEGTPHGVGVASGTFLKDGDVIVSEIEGIGTLTNRCIQER